MTLFSLCTKNVLICGSWLLLEFDSKVESKHITQAHGAWIKVFLSPASAFFSLLPGSGTPESPPSPFPLMGPWGNISLDMNSCVANTCISFSAHFHRGSFAFFFFFFFPSPRKYFSKNDQIFLTTPNTETCCVSNSGKHTAWLWIPFGQEIIFQKMCALNEHSPFF